MNFQARIEKIKEIIKSKNMDALMIFSPADLYYLSGYYPHMPWYPEYLFRLTGRSKTEKSSCLIF
jgi:Xaa-Pro aminopeptidase